MKPTKKKIRPFFQEGPVFGQIYYVLPDGRKFFFVPSACKWLDSPVRGAFSAPKLTPTAARKRWPEIFKSKLPE